VRDIFEIMSEPGQGRARGRGGRGRRPQPQDGPGQAPGTAPPPSAGPPQPAPGSGGEPTRAPMGRGRSRARAAPVDPTQAHPQPVMQSGGPDPMAGGRGVQRGGAREHACGGNLAQEMGRLNVSGRPEYQRRDPYARFREKQYKEPNVACQGKFGQPVQLQANYFSITLADDNKIFQYHVDFVPPVENIKVKFAMIATAAEQFKGKVLIDGGIVYLNTLLPSDPYTTTAARNYDNTPIQMKFTRTCEVMKTSPQFLQISDILMKRVPFQLGMKQIRDHYFDMNKTIRIENTNLRCAPGSQQQLLNLMVVIFLVLISFTRF